MKLTIPEPAPCEHCGDGAIFHRLTYWSIAIDEVMKPLSQPGPVFRGLARLVHGIERRATPWLLERFIRLGWATEHREHDDGTQLLAQMIWREAKKRGIEVREVRLFGLPRNVFLARYPDSALIAFEGIPTPGAADLDRMPWMDDKARLKEEFRKLGLPVAKGGAVSSERAALALYRTLTPPVIAKPFSGSASRHTVLHIADEGALLRAYRIAKQVAPKVVIEEELSGPVYRATVVGGRFAAALRRDQPQVIGDGVSSIRTLAARANEHPKRQGPYFHHVRLDDAAAEELAWQGYDFDTVLPDGVRAVLHQKINWSVGGTTADVTDEVHPDNVTLFEEAARVLRAPIVGIDFIIPDITRSWKEQERLGILECNSMPFFDNHHLPFEGQPRDVAALIWDMRLQADGRSVQSGRLDRG